MAQNNSRSGMTLIEVTAATVLAVLLVAAMSGVLRSLRIQKEALTDKESQPAWQRQLVNEIRWNLTNSQDMITQPRQLRLLGFSGRDPVSREVNHRLSEICYTVQESKGTYLLLRREASLDAMSSDLNNSESNNQELIAIGVAGIFLTSIEDTIKQDAVSQLLVEGEDAATPDQWIPVPRQIRLVLVGEDQKPIIDEILVL